MSESIVMSPFDESFQKRPRYDFQLKPTQIPEPRETTFKSQKSPAELKTARLTLARVKNRLQHIAKVRQKRQQKATDELLHKHGIADQVSELIFNAKPSDWIEGSHMLKTRDGLIVMQPDVFQRHYRNWGNFVLNGLATNAFQYAQMQKGGEHLKIALQRFGEKVRAGQYFGPQLPDILGAALPPLTVDIERMPAEDGEGEDGDVDVEEFEAAYVLQQAFKEISELSQRKNDDFDRYIAAQSDDEKFKTLCDKRGKENDELIQSPESSKKQLEESKAAVKLNSSRLCRTPSPK